MRRFAATIAQVLIVAAWAGAVTCFTMPCSGISQRLSTTATTELTPRMMLTPSPSEFSILTTSPLSTFLVSDAVEIIKNVFVTVGVIVALLFGLVLIFSNFVIPQAAQQLEQQAREIDPELWDEYQAKLGPNEILAMRPELMQELGDRVRAKMVSNFEAAEKRQREQAQSTSATAPPKGDDDAGVIEAVIISKERKEE